MSPSVARVTDSTSEVHTLGLGDRWTVIPLEIEIDGRRLREGPELSAIEFHALLQQANTVPSTIPPPPDRFAETYARLLRDHDRILSIHLSAALSRTVEHARQAAERIGASDRVSVVDSRLAGLPLGLICLEAEARLERNVDPARVANELAVLTAATRTYFSVYTLDFLYWSGRLERPQDGGSGRPDDRPILALEDGRLALIERVVGETTRVQRMVELVAGACGQQPIVGACVYAGARGEEAAEQLERQLARVCPTRRWNRAPLGPVL